MGTTVKVWLFAAIVGLVGLRADAQCAGEPEIANLRISHSITSYTLTWDAPPGISYPVYEILEWTQPEYCPFQSDRSQYAVIDTTSATTFTGAKSTPESAYLLFVRVQGNPCVESRTVSATDSFSSPPAKPVVGSAVISGGQVRVSFDYGDGKAVAIWLYRVADQKFIGATSPCASNPKTIVDPSPLSAGPHQYRLIAFNTGNATGSSGVASDSFTASPQTLPRVLFAATPTTIRAGESAKLVWRTENADSVSISGIGSRPASGAAVVSPQTTTTFTLTATNDAGATTRDVTIEVITEPEVVVTSLPQAMVQGTNSGGATTSYVLRNVGGAATTITLDQEGDFFTQSPASFALLPGQRREITITGEPRPTGAYRGLSIPSGPGVPPGMAIPVRLLAAPTPSGPTAARAVQSRVDIAAPDGTDPSGTVSFRNTGEATIQAVLVSTVPWLVPHDRLVEVDPGQTVEIGFSVDRSRRHPGARMGSVEGKMLLVFRSGAAGKSGQIEPHNGAATTTSLVTVVDTTKPAVVPGELPPLGPGEVALFIPGAGHIEGGAGLFFSDIALVNVSGAETVDGIELYYTPASGPAQTLTTSVSGLSSSTPMVLADIVRTVFDAPATLGSLQIRTADVEQLSVNANILLQTRGDDPQFFGNTIPALRSDRSAGPGESVYITGLTSTDTSHTNLFIQEMAGSSVTVDLEFFDDNGVALGSTEGVEVGPFRLAGLFHSIQAPTLPDGAVSAVITSRASSTGRFGAYATPVDRRSGDSWSLVDWNLVNGFGGGEEMVVPVAGAVRGANDLYFRTDLAVVNRSGTAAGGTLRYIPRPGEGRAPIDRTITLGAGESAVLDDVTTTLFDIDSDTIGFMQFTPTAGSMAVTSRNFATVGDDPGTFGTGVPTLSAGRSLRLGDVRTIGGVKDSSLPTIGGAVPGTFRSNMAMMETTGAGSVTVRVTVYFSFSTGTTAVARGSESKEYTLGPNEFVQLSRVSREVLGESRDDYGDFDNLQVEFAVVDGDGAAAVLVSSVDNGSGDSILRVD